MCRHAYTILFILCFLIVIYCHAVNVFRLLSIRDVLSGQPIYSVDYTFHYANILLTRTFLKEYGHTWAYSPYFMAGYPARSIAVENMGVSLVLLPLQEDYLPLAFNFYILVTFLLVPVAVFITAVNFGFDRWKALLAAFLSVFLWGSYRPIYNMLYLGMFTWVFCSYASLLAVSFFYKWVQKQTIIDYVLSLIIAAFLLSTNPLSLLVLLIPLTTMSLYSVKGKSKRILKFIIVWVIGVILLNSFWLYWFIQFRHYVEASNITFERDWPNLLKYHFSPSYRNFRNIPLDLLILFALPCLYRWVKRRDFFRALPFVFSILFFITLSNFIFFMKANTNPVTRFTIPLVFFLIIPASDGFYSIASLIRSRFQDRRYPSVLVLTMLLMASVAAGLFNYNTNRLDKRITVAPPRLYDFIDWVKENTDESGRILIEDSWEGHGGSHILLGKGGSFILPLLPLYMEREFIGGPLLGYFIAHYYVNFQDHLLFHRDIREYSPEEFKNILYTYNIKWIIACTKESKDYLEAQNGVVGKTNTFKEGNGFREYISYVVNRTPDYFLEGSGKVKADYNTLEVSNSSQGQIILKYHFLETLKIKPQLKVERYFVNSNVIKDPLGFIKIENRNTTNFVVYNGY